MEIETVLALVREQKNILRSIRMKHPNDAPTSNMVSEALENLTEQLLTLQDLYHYRDAAEHHGTNGGARHDHA